MHVQTYTKLELDEIALALERVNPLFQDRVFDPVETTVLAQDLDFYPGYRLLEISDGSSTPEVVRFVVCGEEDAFVLNFSNDVIYEFNKRINIVLNADNIYAYIIFFFSHVRGRHGRFLIVESVDDIAWRDDPPPEARRAVGKMIAPLTLEKQEEGVFFVRASMVFKDSLFRSLVKVDSAGLVSLSQEELLVEDMPVIDDIFGY